MRLLRMSSSSVRQLSFLSGIVVDLPCFSVVTSVISSYAFLLLSSLKLLPLPDLGLLSRSLLQFSCLYLFTGAEIQ